MTLEIPDQYVPLIIKALDNQHTGGQVLNRADERFREAANLFGAAAERKGIVRASGSTQKKQHGGKAG